MYFSRIRVKGTFLAGIPSLIWTPVCNVYKVSVLQYDDRALSGNTGLQYLPLHGSVHTPDNNSWDTPPV